MAVAVVWRDPITGKTGYTALSSDTLPNCAAGSEAYITDEPGRVDKYNGAAWHTESVGGAKLGSDREYCSGSQDDVLATSTTPASLTLASGSTHVEITNLSLTAAEYLICAFGVDAADAEANLATGGWTVAAGATKLRRIPANALGGGFAYKSASGTPSLGYSEGTKA